uniref:DUF7041 domain-containing protein n=1 Tax=Trichogramma kaykai TaxID=54128 RepID=A0ABD2VW29_9HYME
MVCPTCSHETSGWMCEIWLDKRTIWFMQAGAQFALADDVVELTKYYHVISQLDNRVASEVEDIISNPPEELPNTN